MAPSSAKETALGSSAAQIGAEVRSALTGQTVWVADRRGRIVGTVAVGPEATSVTVTGLAPRKPYSFAVSATNVVGESGRSEWSAQVTTTR